MSLNNRRSFGSCLDNNGALCFMVVHYGGIKSLGFEYRKGRGVKKNILVFLSLLECCEI